DLVVRTAVDPALQLGGAPGVQRMPAEHRVEDFYDGITPAPLGPALRGVLHELVEADLVVAAAAARELQERHQRIVAALRAEESPAIGRELALPVPLEQRDLNREERDA